MNRFRGLRPQFRGEQGQGEALRQQGLLLELIPVLLLDPADQIIYWNRAAEVMYGFTPEQAVGKSSRLLLQTEFPEPLEDILGRLRTGRQWQGELTQVRSDGRRISIASEWIAYLDERGRLEAIIVVNTEVTGRKQAEEALAKTRARFDMIIASAMDAIISTDADQRIVVFNPAAERMFGLPAREAVGQHLSRFIPERFRHAHARQVEEFGRSGTTSRRMGSLGVVTGLRANGEEFPLEASIAHADAGGTRFFTAILRDITQRQQAEAALREAQAALAAHAENLERTVSQRTAQLRESVAELQAFSYSLSHDLRAPLRAISNFTSIVLHDYGAGLNPDATELLRKVTVAVERMDRLMQDVLAFSRVSRQSLAFTAVDVEPLVRELVAARPELRAASIQIESPLLPMLGEQTSLIQCLTNLLSNAVKFVAPGVKPQVRLRTEKIGDQVRLWVIDNGIGIASEAQRKIFELFHRLSHAYEGTGIGLAIVKKATERMHGHVGVESKPGHGSRFWLQLPSPPVR